MSNPIKAIGKAFKSVVRVIKKVALPALAIGAVVLTGGAALGVLPGLGGAGGPLASLGIKGALASVLTSAATSATIGAGLSAVTGGNIIKGATTGFITGGVLGGANAALGGAKGLGATAASGSSSGASNALNVIDNGKIAAMGSGSTNGFASTAAASGKAGGLGAAMGGEAVINPVAASTGPVTSGGGILGFLNRNQIVGGMAIQGLGQGLMASEQNKAAQRERDQIAANYGDGSGLPQYQSQGNNFANAADVFNAAIYAGKKIEYDPKTGLKVSNG